MIKYRIPYYDLKNNAWRVELSNVSYSGAIITLNTAQGQGCTIGYTGTDDPFEPIIPSTAKFTVVKHNLGLIDVSELKNSGDKDWSVNVYKNNVLFWTGYLVPDGIQEFYQSLPYDVDLTATDGLKMLQGTIYGTNNWPLATGIVQRSFISHVRDMLFGGSQLGKPLPIRWVGYLKNYITSAGLDAYTQMTYSPRGEGYTDYNGNKYSSYYILENYLRALESRIYQRGGKWIIERIPDVMTGTWNWSEMSAEYDGTTVPVLTTGTETRLKNIGTDYIVDDGAYTLNLPGFSKVTATYEAAKSENVMPNGTFDSSLFAPFQWYASNSDLDVQQVNSINGRAGSSAQLTFPANTTGTGRVETFALRNGVGGIENLLPIDTTTLYKRMSIGFTLMPQNGFPFNTADGIIQWDLAPLQFRIELTAFGTTTRVFTLNENGFWIPKPAGGNFIQGTQTKTITTSTTMRIDTEYSGNVIVGDSISYQFKTNPPTTVAVPQQYSNDLYGYLQYAGQFLVDNSPYVQSWGVSVAVDHFVLTLSVSYDTGGGSDYQLTQAVSTSNRDGSINLLTEPSKIGDVITVNFDRFQGIKLPDFKDDSGHKYAAINWFFYVQQGQRYTLDDVYLKLDDNQEVYEYSYSGSKFTGTEDYSLKISSAVDGFYTSNVMSSFNTAPQNSKYTDSTGYVGTLTDLFARTVLRFRSKSLEMFEGKILGDNIDFGSIYTVTGITGKKMLPLSLSYNTELCETEVTIVELNQGSDVLTRKFYGSNDKPLSNAIIN